MYMKKKIEQWSADFTRSTRENRTRQILTGDVQITILTGSNLNISYIKIKIGNAKPPKKNSRLDRNFPFIDGTIYIIHASIINKKSISRYFTRSENVRTNSHLHLNDLRSHRSSRYQIHHFSATASPRRGNGRPSISDSSTEEEVGSRPVAFLLLCLRTIQISSSSSVVEVRTSLVQSSMICDHHAPKKEPVDYDCDQE